MPHENVAFKDSEVTYKKVYNFILHNIPDYAKVIDSKKKLD